MDKTKRRELWILKALFDCTGWSQDDIKKAWFLMRKESLLIQSADAKDGNFSTESSEKKALAKITKKYKPPICVSKDFKNKVQDEYRGFLISETLKEIKRKDPKTFKKFKNSGLSQISTILTKLSKKNDETEGKLNDILKDDAEKNENENECIVKFDSRYKKIRNKGDKPLEDIYYLTENYDTLYYILKQINQVGVPPKLKERILNDLMNSEYIKRVVNKGLVETIESKLYLSLKDEDKKLILFFIERYPTVLYNTLKEMNKPLVMINEDTPLYAIFDRKKVTNSFLMDVKNWAYQDIKEIRDDFIVDYEITVTIQNDDGEIVKHINSHRIPSDPEEEKLLDSEEEFGSDLAKFRRALNEALRKIVGDKKLFLKGNGEKIHDKEYDSIDDDLAPY